MRENMRKIPFPGVLVPMESKLIPQNSLYSSLFDKNFKPCSCISIL